MILLDPRAPFVFGVAMIGLLAVYLVVFHAMPGPLAGPHQEVITGSGFGTCERCHTDDGLSQGCLECHAEIAGQIEDDQGYHAFLVREGYDDCATCHREHMGANFPLVSSLSWRGRNPNHFKHDYVSFSLTGAHDDLSCDACHSARVAKPFALPGFPSHPRASTFLGLTQRCVDCHEDVHAGGLASECLSCHDQNQWRPAPRFHHDEYFVLEGAHARAACSACHLIPASDDPNVRGMTDNRLLFHRVQGTACTDCHEDPHRVSLAAECTTCHLAADEAWTDGARGVTTEVHARTAFALDAVHAKVACKECHSPDLPYSQRFPDPSLPGYVRQADRCEGCHGDPHGGQFSPRYASCLDCHEKDHFSPSKYSVADHAKTFPLVEAHASVECKECHTTDPNTGIQQFASVSRQCEGCHEDPHGSQFQGRYATCSDCHDQIHFTPSRFDLTQHAKSYPLNGAHVSVECEACHAADPNTGIQRFTSVTRQCIGCHDDPHGDQFAGRYATCLDCHDESHFKPSLFDATLHAKTYPLTSPHAALECVACHPVEQTTGVQQFVSVPRQCEGCHEDPHAGQFQGRFATCLDCHEETRFKPSRYDVARHKAVYPLTGEHATASCSDCHETKGQAQVQQFVSTTRLCKNCHQDPHGPQFQTDLLTGDCSVCHVGDASTFAIRPYDHNQRTGYPLTGAHAKAQCSDCHRERRVGDPNAPTMTYRIYRETPTACAACHRDEHRGQFRRQGVTLCDRCHGSTTEWSAERFDHNRDSRFVLEGVHADVECQACHPSVRQPDGQYVTQYRPLGTRCEDCHGFVPKQ